MNSFTTQARTAASGLRDRARRKRWLRLPPNATADPTVKPTPYLPVYERVLGPVRRRAFSLLELGVWKGDSLKMWHDAFPRATVVGVDLVLPDLPERRRMHIVRGDQTDPDLMRRLRKNYAPDGFDVIIDDASHIGVTTARSLQILYTQHLRPGGLYCIEDWGTGYLPDWSDGGRIASQLDLCHLDAARSVRVGQDAAVSMPSHDIGAVGLVKRLIDHTGSGTVRYAQPDEVGEVLPIEYMTVWDGIVVLRKSS